MILKFALGLNRVAPPHELLTAKEKFVQCSVLQNFVVRDKCIRKIGGTEAYNSTSMGTANVPWVHRSYHKRGDGSFRKVGFCFYNGAIYRGDDVARTLTSSQGGFRKEVRPMDVTMQVSGNSILYFISGEDEVYKYDGNGGYEWEKTTLNDDLGRIIVDAAVHLDRMWYVSKKSSTLAYSTTLRPEDFTVDAADIIVGQETDSVIRRVIVGANETLYIFKNNSIWQLYGRTPATYQLRKITDKYGLATKRSIYPVGSGFVFLDEFTKELYFFGGTESSIVPFTERYIKLREILDQENLEDVCMTVHNGLFRFAFKHRDDDAYQDRELIYAINEPGVGDLPMWSMIKGSKVLSYSVWQKEGDRDELVTGRSNIGKIMYHSKDPYYARGLNFDGEAIECKVRSKEVVASEDMVVRFKGFFIKAKPGSQISTVTFNYYLDGRTGQPGTQEQGMAGELRDFGAMSFSRQVLLNDRIIPLNNKSRGTSISFEISDNNLNTSLELYSVALTAQKRYKIRGQLAHT